MCIDSECTDRKWTVLIMTIKHGVPQAEELDGHTNTYLPPGDTVSASTLEEAGAWVQGGLQFPFCGTIDLLTVLTYGIPDQAQVSFLSCRLDVSGMEKWGYSMKCGEVPQCGMISSPPPSCSHLEFNQQNQGTSCTEHPIKLWKDDSPLKKNMAW